MRTGIALPLVIFVVFVVFIFVLSQAAAGQLAAREALALARYTQLRQWFEQGNVTAACLSYQAFYQCATFLPACRLGEAQELCSFVCEEHAIRCSGDKDACKPSDQYCSSAAVPALSLVAALATLVAGRLVVLR